MKKEESWQNPEFQDAERDYNRAVFITEAQPRLKKAFFTAWVVFDILLVLGALFYFAYYLSVGSVIDRRLAARTGNNTAAQFALSQNRQADALVIRRTDVFASGDGNYDFRAVVENPNAEWYAEITYQFVSSQGETKQESGFLMPGESKPLTSLRQTFAVRPTDAELVVKNLTWRRVNAHIAPDFSVWMEDRNNFRIIDAVYSDDLTLESTQIPRSTFTLINDSAYSYRNAVFLVEISRGGVIAGTTRITVPSLMAGESREISVNWFQNAPPTGTVLVQPSINFFDESAYIAPIGETGTDLRDVIEQRR